MKRTLVILSIVIATAVAFTSCAAGGRSQKGGCHLNQGYIGYGNR